MEVKEDREYEEGGEEEEAPTQNKRSQRCGLGDVGNEADTREILSTLHKKITMFTLILVSGRLRRRTEARVQRESPQVSADSCHHHRSERVQVGFEVLPDRVIGVTRGRGVGR